MRKIIYPQGTFFKDSIVRLLLNVFILMLACGGVSAQSRGYTQYINTFVDTSPLTGSMIIGYELPIGWRSWAWLAFPGSSIPNEMVQLSPITEFCSGAGYE
ncbi:hypothetical protein [Pedobacter frigidisoli]|uniref:hypothetical protein n=1 Tax=Pedobacter frigidisoli TaxID=2530455 RepID=UPI001CEC7DDF|nr:hypothetical protein [Pedobacter frigidisoli]